MKKARAVAAVADDTDVGASPASELTELGISNDETMRPDEDEPRRPSVSVASAPKPTQPMQAVRVAEDVALREYLDALGPSGSFKVRISRTHPKTVRVNGRDYAVAGHLTTINESIDEEGISEQFGGGTYNLTITTRRGGSNSFKYAGHRTVTVAGDPKIERLPTNEAQASHPAPAAEPNGAVIKEVFGLLRDQVEHNRDAKQPGIDPAVQVLIDQLREDAKRKDRELDSLRQEMAHARTQKPPEDPFKDRLLDTLIGGESARILAIRTANESEVRQLKEFNQQELQRREERHDRALQDLRTQHDRDLATIRASYEREIAAVVASHNATISAAKVTAEIQTHTLNSEIKRLERDNDELRKDNRELREKKEKGLVEQIKDLEVVKEALGMDKDDGGASIADKVISAFPAAVESIGGIIQTRMAQNQQVAQAQAQAQVKAQPPKPQARVVVSPKTGERYIQTGNKLEPVKPKPRLVTTDAGEQIEVPQIAPTVITAIIAQLEAAFGRGEEPAIVAQTGKAQIPPDILAWIRQHHTDQVSGVDLFMTKVAKLPGTSPLSTQAGRNWLRKVGTALISE